MTLINKGITTTYQKVAASSKNLESVTRQKKADKETMRWNAVRVEPRTIVKQRVTLCRQSSVQIEFRRFSHQTTTPNVDPSFGIVLRQAKQQVSNHCAQSLLRRNRLPDAGVHETKKLHTRIKYRLCRSGRGNESNVELLAGY